MWGGVNPLVIQPVIPLGGTFGYTPQVTSYHVGQNPVIPAHYAIYDPTRIAARGYIDPTTGHPFLTSQPYAGNLSDALEHQAQRVGRPVTDFNCAELSDDEKRFINQYFDYHNP